MNCKLCSGDEQIIPTTEENFTNAKEITDRLTATLPESTGQPIIFNPAPPIVVEPVRSDESKAVLSVTDDYAQSVDDLKKANDAVKNMEDHLAKMTGILTDLKTEVVRAKICKDELKRKVLETLAMGGE